MIDYTPIEKRAAIEPAYTPAAQRSGPFEKFQIPQKAPAYTPLAQRLGDMAGGVGEKLNSLFASKVSAKSQPASVASALPDQQDEAYPVVFGELSNRPMEKKELEARVIFTTAVNRQREYGAKGMKKSLNDVLSMENQYQAYGGPQYQVYKKGVTNAPDIKKKKEVDAIVDKILAEIKAGTFKPLSDKAYYYAHGADGSIEYDDTRPLFK